MSPQPRIFIKIWDRDRLIKKSFLCCGNISSLIEKANNAGIPGSILLLESDGTEVEDVEILEYYNNKNEVFQLLENSSQWTPPPSTSSCIVPTISTSAKSIKYIPHDNLSDNNVPDVNSNNIITWITTSNITPGIENESPQSPLTSTISMSSGRNTPLSSDFSTNSSNFGAKQAEKIFDDYEFPYNKLSEDVLEKLNQGKPLGHLLSDFVHCIVNDMRKKSFYIPQKVFRSLSTRLIQIYPRSLAIMDSQDKLICNEPITLVTKLSNHNNYLNRASETLIKTPILKRKINLTDVVPYFYEKNTNENKISDDEAVTKKVWLKENYGREVSNDLLSVEILEAFKQTFTQQRKFINENPTISEIRENWPHLLSQKFLVHHFYELMDIEENLFFSKWHCLKNKIFLLGNSLKNIRLEDEEDDNLKILIIITAYFKENLILMLKKYPLGTTLNEVEVLSSTPFLAVIGQEERDKYPFNIKYPMDLSQTLEAMQKLFFDIDVNFAFQKKNKINFKSKVINFLKKILQ